MTERMTDKLSKKNKEEMIREAFAENSDPVETEIVDDSKVADADADTTTEETAKKETKKKEKADPDMLALKKEKEALQKALDETNDRYLRMMAEYDNFRRRAQKEREGAYSDAYADALAALLPVLDNLERAAAFAPPDGDDKLAAGVTMTLNQFGEAIAKLGVEAFGESGETFNPGIHNAVMHIEDESLGENVITDVFQKGYRRGDKIIRFAMVKVAN